MESVLKTIEENNLIEPNKVYGIAVSGGMDSMSLLAFMNENKEKFEIDIVAIHVDHALREDSYKDALFVAEYCKENSIRFHKFRVDVNSIIKREKISVEEAARKARYGVFDTLIEKGIIDKIVLAHHFQDQAETILLNLFRGSGMLGIKGMDLVRDNYIRPMLNTEKNEIQTYLSLNQVDYRDDETNFESDYARNYLRNEIMPLINRKWKSATKNIIRFSKIASQDDEFINKQVRIGAIMFENNIARIPLSYFIYDDSIVNRMLRRTFKELKCLKNIESKHITLIKQMVSEAENGTRIDLPNGVKVHKEYDFITIEIIRPKKPFNQRKFKSDIFEVDGFGKVTVKRTYKLNLEEGKLLLDTKKVPKTAIWRTREDGDIFVKFGGVKQKLKTFFINKKVPVRIRNYVPVLADGNNILAVAGYEISDSVKITPETKSVYVITCELEKKNKKRT